MKNIILKFIYKILAYYGRVVVRKYNPSVIAITGSVGKTGTKEAVYQVFHDAFGSQVRKNEGNLNAEIGIPLTILGYDKLPNKFFWPIFLFGALFRLNPKQYPKYLILEMGVEKKGDMDYFASIVKPNFCIITSAGFAHLANFKNIGEYQKEKLSIITKVPEDGKILLNYDDPTLSNIRGKRIVSVAIKNKKADYWTEDIALSLSGTEFRICSLGHKIAVKSNLLGSHQLNSLVFAFALADIFKIPLLGVAKSLEKLKSYPGRMNLIEGRDDVLIIDDTYNSNPSSLKASLSTLGELKYAGRKVAIIGNMNELGSMEKKSHAEIGAFARGRCDLAIFVGRNGEIMRESYGSHKSSLFFKDRDLLIDKLPEIIQKEDLVLVKASQNNNFFEEVVKNLMKNKAKADTLLARQSKFWQNKKRKL